MVWLIRQLSAARALGEFLQLVPLISVERLAVYQNLRKQALQGPQRLSNRLQEFVDVRPHVQVEDLAAFGQIQRQYTTRSRASIMMHGT